MGLGVNKSTHTDMSMRQANDALYGDLVSLGDIDANCDK